MTNTISMTKLTKLLNEKGIKANFDMTGGNCGTIYMGEFDKDGRAEFAIGPSNYRDDVAYFGDFCWGLDDDGESTPFTFEGNEEFFTEEILADHIANDYKELTPAIDPLSTIKLSNVEIEIGGEMFWFYPKEGHSAYYQVGKLGEIGEFYIPMNKDGSADVENVSEIEIEWENA